MKNGWQTKSLGELCSFENGDRGENYPSKSVQTHVGVPFINAGHLSESGVDFSGMNYIPRERFELLGNGKIQKDDILFCLRGSLGKFASVGDLNEGAIASSLVIIRPGIALKDEFLLAYLQSDLCAEMINAFKNGAAQPNLSAASLKKFEIPLPPPPEQQRIVGVLNEAFDGIAIAKANAEKNLQNARAIFESHLQSVFTQRGEGWVEKHLKEVCEKITDGTHQTPKYFDEGTVFLSSRNVTSGVIDWDRIKYIDTKQHLEMHRRVAPRRDDILLAKNGTTGVAAIVDRDTTFDIYVSLALLRALPVIRPRLLLQFINSPAAKIQFNKRLKGVGVPNLHLEEIREVRVAFPSDLGEQDRVIAGLDDLHTETQRLQTLYQQKLAALGALKKSLLHQAFSGSL